jgi:nitroimidazol reductase NimA-like FMN-containing flavoprotein (pyridoxamine 5'-phosphate oxidase superfamily)
MVESRESGEDQAGERSSAVYDGRTMLELLGPAECWRLLGAQRLGRVGLVVAGEPVILPVNYVVHARSVVFRTAGGTKLEAVTSWPTVAFEVDAVEGERGGWSVLLTGRAEEIHEARIVREVERLGLEPWAPGAKLHWVRIAPRRVTGRRLPGTVSSRRGSTESTRSAGRGPHVRSP